MAWIKCRGLTLLVSNCSSGVGKQIKMYKWVTGAMFLIIYEPIINVFDVFICLPLSVYIWLPSYILPFETSHNFHLCLEWQIV